MRKGSMWAGRNTDANLVNGCDFQHDCFLRASWTRPHVTSWERHQCFAHQPLNVRDINTIANTNTNTNTNDILLFIETGVQAFVLLFSYFYIKFYLNRGAGRSLG